jgi:hypothetical protein
MGGMMIGELKAHPASYVYIIIFGGTGTWAAMHWRQLSGHKCRWHAALAGIPVMVAQRQDSLRITVVGGTTYVPGQVQIRRPSVWVLFVQEPIAVEENVLDHEAFSIIANRTNHGRQAQVN